MLIGKRKMKKTMTPTFCSFSSLSIEINLWQNEKVSNIVQSYLLFDQENFS